MTRIVVAGAGSVGCFVGGLLAAVGHDVTLFGRPSVLSQIAKYGLTLTDFTGFSEQVSPGGLKLSVDPACLAGADIVLVAVKSAATRTMAVEIATHAPANAVVVSLQNGMENAQLLQEALPGRDVRAAMVGFNVVAGGSGRFHRAMSGDVCIEAGPGGLPAKLAAPGLHLRESDDIIALQWGKMLINLTNAVDALSGLPLRTLLLDRAWRRLIADQLKEALAVLRAVGIHATMSMPIPAWLVPHVLRLPTPIFSRIAASMLTIDPRASSSMAQDLAAGRPTEIEAFQETIVALGEAYGVATPINARVAKLVREAEARGAGCPGLEPAELRPAV